MADDDVYRMALNERNEGVPGMVQRVEDDCSGIVPTSRYGIRTCGKSAGLGFYTSLIRSGTKMASSRRN